MGDDQPSGACTNVVGVVNSVGALWLLSGGALLVCVALCFTCLLGVTCFDWGDFVY